MLKNCSHVFVRNDTIKPPLKSPYSGPFKVIGRTEKYFTIAVNGKQDTVSIDRIKPAFNICDDCQPESRKRGRPKKRVTFSLEGGPCSGACTY